jgi:hypothetical protein
MAVQPPDSLVPEPVAVAAVVVVIVCVVARRYVLPTLHDGLEWLRELRSYRRGD